MEHYHLTPQNPSPEPWNAHRPIDGQDGYFWIYYSADSDVRVVHRRDVDIAGWVVAVGTVRTRLPDSDADGEAPFAAYDADDEWVAASSSPWALAQVVALHDRAARLAAQRAIVEVREVTADRTSLADIEHFRQCRERAGFLDWDTDFGRGGNPLSGRDGDPTPLSLLHDLGVDTEPDDEIRVALALRYVDAFRDAWREELLRVARDRIAQAEQGERG